jgi:hypothetical protein
MNEDVRIKNLRTNLLKSRGFRYLRYIHLRDFLSRVRGSVNSVGVCGAGQGLAELALALEFPELEFTLTDVVGDGRPNYWTAMQRCMQWEIGNLRFGVWDALAAPPRRFDAVVSTEVLEHIEQASLAISNLRRAATKALYCLTPFAGQAQNSDSDRRRLAYLQHGHYVCGFDEGFFLSVLGHDTDICGAYWRDFGLDLRGRLNAMSDDEIALRYDDLLRFAERDVIRRKPEEKVCLAIKAVLLS